MIDLAKFMFIWALIIAMYVSVSLLLFSELKLFHTVFDVWIIYFESAMGSWNLHVYDSKVYGQKGNNE